MQNIFPHQLPRLLGKYEFLVYYLLMCAEQEHIAPVSAKWILQNMPQQTSHTTVTAALEFLCRAETQMAFKVTKGWRLNGSAMQLPPGIGKIKNHAVCDSPAVVVNDLTNTGSLSTITTLTTSTPKDHSVCDSALRVLRKHGVFGKTAEDLASLEWATTKYIEAMMEKAEKGRFDNPVGMAIYWIKEHAPIPEAIDTKDADYRERHKYAQGLYAEYFDRDDEEV